MNDVVICIPTYKRPDGLKRLINSIFELEIDRKLIRKINIVVVDNDVEKSAETIVLSLSSFSPQLIQLVYHSYSVKGLSNVRNELIKMALDFKSNFILFVDDDEYVIKNWLNDLTETIIRNNGDVAMGPVLSVFEEEQSGYISNWFQRKSHTQDEKLDYIRTGNLIINTDSLLRFKVLFDPRFNKTGSEDTYFGRQLTRLGARIFWSSKAIVFEHTPKMRANLQWLIKRKYRVAYTFTYILKIEKNYLGLFKKTIVSFIYIIVGVCTSIITLANFNKKYWGVLKISEGIGGIAGLFNLKYNEYK